MSKLEEAKETIQAMDAALPEEYFRLYYYYCRSLFIKHDGSGDPLELANLLNISHLALGLAGESGEVADHVKKLIRDGKMDREKVQKELGDVYWYLVMLTRELGFDPMSVMEANMLHLARRKDENKIQGSGSDR